MKHSVAICFLVVLACSNAVFAEVQENLDNEFEIIDMQPINENTVDLVDEESARTCAGWHDSCVNRQCCEAGGVFGKYKCQCYHVTYGGMCRAKGTCPSSKKCQCEFQ